jgi:hypothetical protein
MNEYKLVGAPFSKLMEVPVTNVSKPVGDTAQVDEAAALLKMRENQSNIYKRLALELRINKLPRQILAQGRAKAYPMRTEAPASIADLSATEKKLLTGALEKATPDEAVRQIYDNMFTLTGWLYKGSAINSNGLAYTQGGEVMGMCESYRNAFQEALRCYKALRKIPEDGDPKISRDQSLVDERFCTGRGLTLMGNGLKGNVYLKVNGFATPLEEGIETINRFVFQGHWRLTVNDVVYDPIFRSIGGNPVDLRLEGKLNMAQDGSCFLPDLGAPSETGEFDSGYIWVTDWKTFEKTVEAMEALYDDNTKEVDDILSGKTATKDTFRSDRRSYRKAKELVKESVGDPATFRKVSALAAHWMVMGLENEQNKAVGKILDLAAK